MNGQKPEILSIDGSLGEGGGQILRSALALSLCLQKPFRLTSLRAARKKPGLRQQHLTAVLAAAEISSARVEGAALGSQALTFIPQAIKAGHYHFDIGTAGSTTLLLQTVLPPLLTADGPSQLIVQGGTHNPQAPPFDFLQQAFFPLLRRMGAQFSAELERPGFYPAGGGLLRVQIEPVEHLKPLRVTERGEILEIRAVAAVSQLPLSIAQRELRAIGAELALPPDHLQAIEFKSARGPGNVVTLFIRSQHVTEVFSGFGLRGVRAEKVAAGVVQEARRYLNAGVPVAEHLADQLLLPLALAGGGAYVTLTPSLHTTTNSAVIEQFLPVKFRQKRLGDDIWQISL